VITANHETPERVVKAMREKLVFVYTTKIAAKQPNNCNAYGIRYDSGQGNVRSPPDAKAGDDAAKPQALIACF